MRTIGRIEEPHFTVDVQIPAAVYEVHQRGYSIIPQTGGEPKVPLVPWRELQDRQLTLDELSRIVQKGQPGTWALATGHASVVVLDFDGEAGRKLCNRWKLSPNVVTRSGGYHVWLKDIPFPVKTGHARGFPGLELKGERSSATFFGTVTEGPKAGVYELVSDEPMSANSLPSEARNVVQNHRAAPSDLRPRPETAGDGSTPDIASVCLTRALVAVQERREGYEHRNEAGFALFCQMRDNRVPQETAHRFVPLWVALMNDMLPNPDDVYSESEALDSLEQAYTEAAREPNITRVLLGTETSGLVRLSDVETTTVEWLWPRRIPLGKLTMFDGDPERGKSAITVDLAARFTVGRAMPDGEHAGDGNVLFIAAEDAVDDTIKPRFVAAGGDPERAFYYPLPVDPETGRVRPLMIPEDLDAIEDRIREHDIRLIIIDPITAFLSDKINSNNDASVRRALTPLKEVAEANRCAIVLVRHLNKDSGESNAMYRGGGSIAFSGAARSAWVVAPHPTEPGTFVFARVKSNIAKAVPSLTYTIEESQDHLDVPVVKWGEATDLTARDLFASKDGRKEAPARREAEQFLAELLGDGPVPAQEVKTAAEEAGLKPKTVDRAKASLGVVSRRVADPETGVTRGWCWVMPGTELNGEIVLPDRD